MTTGCNKRHAGWAPAEIAAEGVEGNGPTEASAVRDPPPPVRAAAGEEAARGAAGAGGLGDEDRTGVPGGASRVGVPPGMGWASRGGVRGMAWDEGGSGGGIDESGYVGDVPGGERPPTALPAAGVRGTGEGGPVEGNAVVRDVMA